MILNERKDSSNDNNWFIFRSSSNWWHNCRWYVVTRKEKRYEEITSEIWCGLSVILIPLVLGLVIWGLLGSNIIIGILLIVAFVFIEIRFSEDGVIRIFDTLDLVKMRKQLLVDLKKKKLPKLNPPKDGTVGADIFFELTERKIVFKQWRRHYNSLYEESFRVYSYRFTRNNVSTIQTFEVFLNYDETEFDFNLRLYQSINKIKRTLDDLEEEEERISKKEKKKQEFYNSVWLNR